MINDLNGDGGVDLSNDEDQDDEPADYSIAKIPLDQFQSRYQGKSISRMRGEQ